MRLFRNVGVEDAIKPYSERPERIALYVCIVTRDNDGKPIIRRDRRQDRVVYRLILDRALEDGTGSKYTPKRNPLMQMLHKRAVAALAACPDVSTLPTLAELEARE